MISFDYQRAAFNWIPYVTPHKYRKSVVLCECGSAATWKLKVHEDFACLGCVPMCDSCRDEFRLKYPSRLHDKHKKKHVANQRVGSSFQVKERFVGNRSTGRRYSTRRHA